MSLVWNIVLGLVIAFIGVSLPGLINMTVVKICLERSLNAALRFCLGACITIFFQAWIAVAFAGYLTKHTEVLSILKGTSVFIFLILTIVFLLQALYPPKEKTKKIPKKGRPILLGMAIAAMNFLNIPFYFTAGTVLEGKGYIQNSFPIYYFFITGLTLGSGIALLCYAYGANWIVDRAQFFTKHLNFFLSGLFFILAMVQGIQLYLS